MSVIKIEKRRLLFFMIKVAEFNSSTHEAYVSTSGVLRVQKRGEKSNIVAAFAASEWSIASEIKADYRK